MKDKNRHLKRTLITLLIIVAGAFACNFLYLMLDYAFNGFVRDWFVRNYVYTEWVPVEEVAEGYFVTTIRWSRLKELVFEVFLWTVILLALFIRLISVVYASWREKKVIHATGQMMDDFMRHDREASEVFPAEYAEVSLQMAQIKASVQRQEQLQKEEAGRKNDLITYLAHDLKTPLTSVVGYLSLLDEAPDMPEAQKEKYVHITLDKARRLEKLINEFFEITRYNLQQIVLEKETVDLHFMLIQMTDEFYPLLAAHGNTVRLELQPRQEEGRESEGQEIEGKRGGRQRVERRGTERREIEGQRNERREIEGQRNERCGTEGQEISRPSENIVVYADGEKLARVFNNILKNAIAYSYPDTEIRVACTALEDRVSVTFSNQGKTIPAQRLDSVFEKFFRLDDARSTNSGGAGLGLAIAKDIVTLHGGTITAHSADEVTTFTVELPMCHAKYPQ